MNDIAHIENGWFLPLTLNLSLTLSLTHTLILTLSLFLILILSITLVGNIEPGEHREDPGLGTQEIVCEWKWVGEHRTWGT